MKILKKILFVVLALVALLAVTALFVKKDFKVTRSIEVNLDRRKVYDYIKYLDNQDNYAIWQARDPNTKKSSIGTDATVGYITTWSSDHELVGSGEQEIIKMEEGRRIDYELRFKTPQEMNSTAYMTTESAGDSKTKVTWAFEGKFPYPANLMLLFIDMDGDLGPDLQEGLNNLKSELESPE